MSQIEVAQIIEQIKQEITVDSNGQGKASIRATARLADVQDSSLRRAFLNIFLQITRWLNGYESHSHSS